jgi:hypothetical protein
MNPTRFINTPRLPHEVIVSVREDDELRNFGSTRCSDDSFAVKHLTDLLRCGRHEFKFSGCTVFSATADERPGDPGPLNPDGTRECCENAERDAGEDEVIEPCEPLTEKLTSELISK